MFKVPKNRGIQSTIWILLREEFLTAICSIKAFKMLVVAYRKDEVFLHNQQHLHNANSMDIDITLRWLKNNTVSPILWSSKSK